MKSVLTITCILISSLLIAQKKYDCIINTKINNDSLKQRRFVGYMHNITDSSISLLSSKNDTAFNWQDLKTVKFRKHNGFLRTVLPSSLLVSFITMKTALYNQPTVHSLEPLVLIMGTATLSTIITIPAGAIIYFTGRNHSYPVNSYPDFLNLKLSASRYLAR